jgi:hypothetical protein
VLVRRSRHNTDASDASDASDAKFPDIYLR